MGVVFSLHGVHGSGKSFVSKPITEDRGMIYVRADAADIWKDITSHHPFFRQSIFGYTALTGYAHALGLGRQHNVMVDFGPRQVLPYIEWWAKPYSKELSEILLYNVERLEKQSPAKIVNVFFVIEKDPDIVLERIKKRNRESAIKTEEEDKEYLLFVDNKLKTLMDQMKSEGHIVEKVSADAHILEKIKQLWNIVDKHL